MTTNVAQIVLREVPRLVVLLNASYEETVRQSERLVPVMDLSGRNDRQARERRTRSCPLSSVEGIHRPTVELRKGRIFP